MENIALSFVLFLVCFCSMSCALYSEKSDSTATKSKIKPIEKQVREMFQMIDDNVEVTTPVVETVEQEFPDTTVTEEVNQDDLIEVLNLDKLTLRKARPVAKALDIRQKVNGKDAPVTWLRVQIRQKLEEKPSLLPVVFEIMEILFPVSQPIDTFSASVQYDPIAS